MGQQARSRSGCGAGYCLACESAPGENGGIVNMDGRHKWLPRLLKGVAKQVGVPLITAGDRATAEVPPVRMPAGAERGDGESAASTPRSRRSSREQAGTSSSAEDEGPISMRGMRLSLQASQANLLARGADKAEDDEEWDDD